MAGIKVDHNAYPVIIQNEITRNLQQGILIQEKAQAHIENNEISDNMKSNIAYGGECSVNTTIIKNRICRGRCEGIFLIDGGKS